MANVRIDFNVPDFYSLQDDLLKYNVALKLTNINKKKVHRFIIKNNAK